MARMNQPVFAEHQQKINITNPEKPNHARSEYTVETIPA
jgi:hypothetical protein